MTINDGLIDTLSTVLLVYFDRTIPRVEIEAVSEFLFHLLIGDINKLPTEALVHRYWTFFENQHKQARSYSTCLHEHRLTEVSCYHDIQIYCGMRFAQKPLERLEQCRRLLTNEENVTTMDVSPNIARIFDNYHSCFQSYRNRVTAKCTEMLRKAITSHHLRATKVIRATMNSIRPLLSLLPTLRVIHLVRDPRAVSLSRIRFHVSGRGILTQRIMESESSRIGFGESSHQIHGPKSQPYVVQEASLYCRHVIADIQSRLALEREFPGRILSVRYEEVVANPEQEFRDVYKFIEEPMPKTTFDELQKLAKQGQTMNVSTKWQDSLTYKDGFAIAHHCAEFFRLLNISSAPATAADCRR